MVISTFCTHLRTRRIFSISRIFAFFFAPFHVFALALSTRTKNLEVKYSFTIIYFSPRSRCFLLSTFSILHYRLKHFVIFLMNRRFLAIQKVLQPFSLFFTSTFSTGLFRLIIFQNLRQWRILSTSRILTRSRSILVNLRASNESFVAVTRTFYYR